MSTENTNEIRYLDLHGTEILVDKVKDLIEKEIAGKIGPTGPTGPTGDTGATGPKGEDGINGLTIKGELEPRPLGDRLFPYDSKINDAYVISRNAKGRVNEGGTGGTSVLVEYPFGAKRGDVYVCVKEAYTKTNAAGLEVLNPPVFEKKFNISWYGEYNDIHIMSTYDNYVVEGYDTDNVKVNDIIIDNGNTLNSRLGNIYKVINVIEEPSDENNEGWEIVNWDDLKTRDKVIITGYDSDFGTESGPIGLPIFPEKVNSINTHKAYELDITETTANSEVYNISPKDTITKYTRQTLSIDDFIFNVEIPNEELQQIAFYVYNPDNPEDEKKYYLQVNGKTASTLRIESSLNEETKSHLFELETDNTSKAFNYIKSLSTRTDNPVYVSLYSANTDGILDYVDWRHYAAGNGVMENQKFKIYRMKKSIPHATPKVIVDTVASVNISQRNLYHSGDNISIKNNTISALGYNHNVSKLSFSEGNSTATGANSHAEGDLTVARGYVSHAEGFTTLAQGEGSHAEGRGTKAMSRGAHAEGGRTSDILSDSIYKIYQDADEPTKYHLVEEEGFETYVRLGMCFCYKNKYYYVTKIEYSDGTELPVVEYPEYPEGYIVQREPKAFWLNETINETSGEPFIVELQLGISYSICTHSEGKNTTAYKDTAHSEGNTTRAVGNGAHAEGVETCALENYSHAEGQSTISVGQASHAEGFESISSGNYSHAEGGGCIASGHSSHAEGFRTEAISNYSHAEGICNLSNNGEKFDKQTISSIGIGSVEETKVNPEDQNSDTIRKFHRKNAVEVMRNGDVYIHGIGDYDGTNSVVEEGEVKAKTLQEVIKENELPQKENELIYFDEENGFISSQLMYSEGLVVDNNEDFELCKQGADVSMATVSTKWKVYGGNSGDIVWSNYWGYCDSIPTNPGDTTKKVTLRDKVTELNVPIYTCNGKPQDYIFNTKNTDDLTGFYSDKKYSKYDSITSAGIINDLKNAGNTDYMAVVPAIHYDENDTTSGYGFCGISLSVNNTSNTNTQGRENVGKENHTVSIIVWTQDINQAIKYHTENTNIQLLSNIEGQRISKYDNNISNGSNASNFSSSILTRVKRENDLITMWVSNPYRSDDDDSKHTVNVDTPIIVDLSNYTLSYTYLKDDGQYEKVIKDFKENSTAQYINRNNELTTYTESNKTIIRNIFDKLRGESYRGFEVLSNPGSIFRNLTPDETILNVTQGDKFNTTWRYSQSVKDWVNETQSLGTPMKLFSGSRLSFNRITNKLFYSDGVTVYQIASLSEGSSSSDSGSNSGSDSGSSSSQSFTLNPAKEDLLGGIKVGANLSITGEGVLTAKGYEWNSSTNTMTITTSDENLGKIHAAGGFYETSDARKKDVQGELSLDKAYDFIRNCEPILYNLKGSDKAQIGLIAQEVREFFPEIVNEDSEGYLSLDYAKLTVIILRVLKDLIDKK